jgi:hypothetical protein
MNTLTALVMPTSNNASLSSAKVTKVVAVYLGAKEEEKDDDILVGSA